jgi:predicted phage terminase large subunit-like protein
VLDVYRERVDYPTLKRAVVAQFEQWRPQIILVEDRSSGMQLIQELSSGVQGRIKAISPTGHKTMRLQAQTTQFANGMVIFPEEAPRLNDCLKELLSFPKGKYDDQVDSISQALGMDAGSRKGAGNHELLPSAGGRLKRKWLGESFGVAHSARQQNEHPHRLRGRSAGS